VFFLSSWSVRILYPADLAACDFLTGITGRLGPEIIGTAVDHNRPSDNFFYGKTVCTYCHTGTSAAQQQRGEISGVFRMRCPGRIIVDACIGKALSPTAVTLVDMKGKKSAIPVVGKPIQPDCQQDTLPALIKPDFSVYPRRFLSACDMCRRSRTYGRTVHTITSTPVYAAPAAAVTASEKEKKPTDFFRKSVSFFWQGH